MKSYLVKSNRLVSVIIISFFLMSCNNAERSDNTADKKTTEIQKKAIPIIFDTDIGNDIDDVLALQMLLNYHKQGKINLLGITLSKSNSYVIDYVDGYCRYNNLDFPLGYAHNGMNLKKNGKYLKQTLDAIVDGEKILQPQRSISDSIPDGYKLLRQLLSEQPDKSVIIIVVGVQTNIARLIESDADEHSPLSGIELIESKVKLISVMGGNYGVESSPEWNIINDLQAAQIVFSKCPSPIIASGGEIGRKLLYPHKSILEDFKAPEKNPLCISYKSWGKMPYDRPTWDLTSVLFAVEPEKKYFDLSPRGIISIDNEGNSNFTPDKNGMHYYLKIDESNIEYTLNALVERVTGKCGRNQ